MGNTSSTDESKKEKIKKKINEARENRLKEVMEGKHNNSRHEKDHHDKEEEDDLNIDFTKYQFPFENLVFEGGGNKGMAYCGSIKVLEDVGILKGIKRVAGTSIGSIIATMVAVGYSADELREAYKIDLTEYVYEVWGGYWSLLPNLFRAFGWNPGDKVYNWLGDLIAKKTGNPDTTFSEVYKLCGKELCIVVTNVNHMREIYCHPKITPDVPVRLAIRMSMSIPGLFQAKSFTFYGETDTFIDGGVICNYPIMCFDGWWLSLKKGDGFVERLQPLKDIPKLCSDSERFGEYNEKTLGFIVFSDSEMDIYRYTLDSRSGANKPSKHPDTTLARNRQQPHEAIKNLENEHKCVAQAVDAFMKAISKSDVDGDQFISRKELETALTKDAFPEEHRTTLFGEKTTVDEILEVLDQNDDGKIHYLELVNFVEQAGISIQQRFLGFKRLNIDGLLSFASSVYAAVTSNLLRVFVKAKDLDRTVGINTGYIEMGDFKLEDGDRDFILKRGENATLAFLRNYVKTRLQ